MPVAPVSGRQGWGVAFLVAAGIVFEIIAAACSSPQTMEINAQTRAGTLMKWVHIGEAGSALFIGIAMAADSQHRVPIAAGGLTAGLLMHYAYTHAMQSGLSSMAQGTETYDQGKVIYSEVYS